MSNERIDDFLSWRGRLEDPEGIPGQTLDDREATWERLMDKLRETPRRRFSGYRIAAACLLLALIPAFHLFQSRNGNPIASHPVTTHRATPISTPSIARQQPAPRKPALQSVPPAPVPGQSRPAKTASPAKSTPPTPPLATLPPAAPTGAPTAATLLAEAPPVTPPPAGLPEIPALAATNKTIKHKEWKVVNIGEINTRFARPHGTAANSPRFGLGDPTINNDTGPTLQDPPGLKIKLSAQN